MGFFDFLKPGSKRTSVQPLKVDMHSHLIPDLDDGAQTMEEALALLQGLEALGYEKVITTPHIFSEFYPNTPDLILDGLTAVRQAAREAGLKLQLEAAAEYYLDETFIELLNRDELLTFGDNFLLFETGFYTQPAMLFDALFEMQTKGYKPILAHPERYQYLFNSFPLLEKIASRGARLQLNLNSLSGQYGPAVKKLAQKMIDAELVDFVGSDLHNQHQLQQIKASLKDSYFERLLSLNLQNNLLL